MPSLAAEYSSRYPYETSFDRQGGDTARTEDALGLDPYSISYLADGSQTRTYRYYFIDGETKDCTSYIITASWNASGVLSNITDQRYDYIGQILQPGA